MPRTVIQFQDTGGYHGRPNPNADLDKYVDDMQNQLRELLTNCGPVKVLWFDDGGAFMVPFKAGSCGR